MARPRQTPVQTIRRLSRRYGLDPRAVIAVARGEGGLVNRAGDIGDAGTSFGPFQLHRGGALPSGIANPDQWAWSPQGINYALRKMQEVGAGGQTGQRAINTIIREFERPADPESSIRNAIGRYGQIPAGNAPVTAGGAAAATQPVAALPQMPRPVRQANKALQRIMNVALGGGPIDQAMNQLETVLSRMPQLTQMMASQLAPVTPPAASPGPGGGGRAGRLPLTTPLPSGSQFMVSDPEGAPGQGGSYHGAVDWFAPAGAPVRSPINGTIVEVKPSQGSSGQIFGGTVKVQGRNGRVWVFRHVDPANVHVGQQVSAGTPLAGVTDWASGSPHTHVELWRSLRGGYDIGNMIDPLPILQRLSGR